MTTMVIVRANHGWPVEVTTVHNGDLGVVTTVPADEEQVFYVWDGRDLLIHEVPQYENVK